MQTKTPPFSEAEKTMANMNFDFNKIQRSFFKTTLKDGRELVVKMPMKKTFEKITAAQEMDLEEMSVADAMDTLGAICAEVLSNNLNKEKITMKYMTDNYDTEEMGEFIKGFMNFVKGVKADPN